MRDAAGVGWRDGREVVAMPLDRHAALALLRDMAGAMQC